MCPSFHLDQALTPDAKLAGADRLFKRFENRFIGLSKDRRVHRQAGICIGSLVWIQAYAAEA